MPTLPVEPMNKRVTSRLRALDFMPPPCRITSSLLQAVAEPKAERILRTVSSQDHVASIILAQSVDD